MKYWFFLCFAVVFEVIGTTALKQSESLTRLWPSLLFVASLGCSFYLLSLAFKVIPVGIAYAVWSGLGIILISIIGWVLLGQRLDVPAMIGIGLILLGVLVMNLFSSSVAH